MQRNLELAQFILSLGHLDPFTFHDGEEVWFHRLDDIVGGTGSLGLAGWLLNDLELLLVSVEEPPTFALAERDAN